MINGKDVLNSYNTRLENYTVGVLEFNINIFKSFNIYDKPILYNREYGSKILSVKITFKSLFGDTPNEMLKSSNELKSKFETDILVSELNITLNNGNNYNGFVNSFGEETQIHQIGYIIKTY